MSKQKGPYAARKHELSKSYHWKAENNIRFFDKLGMTTEQKIKFLADEFAGVHMFAEDNRKAGEPTR
jgi:hypothetical protein